MIYKVLDILLALKISSFILGEMPLDEIYFNYKKMESLNDFH